MKAPDKIYVAESQKIVGDIAHNVFSEVPFSSHYSIEYINKGKMLEWLRNNGVDGGVGDDYNNGFNDALYAVMQMLEQV